MAVDVHVEPFDQQRRSVPVDRRTALGRAIVAILRQAVPNPAHVRINGPDAVARLI